MKPEEQRVAIAETFPELFEIIPGSVDVLRYKVGGCYVDILKDLNAIHEAERKLPDVNALAQYADELDKVCVPVHICPLTHWQAVTMSTAAQRCAALLKTIGKWKDE